MDSKKVIVDPELREARGYLMDVISHALAQMNGHVEIEHTELPSVPMKGDFWKEEGGNVFMELIKGEHNVKDAMFHDVHAEKYTLDEVINKLDYSETYALTIAVREAQIKDIVSSFDGQEIYFDEPVAVSRDDNDIEKDYVAGVKIDDDGSLNISGHRVDDDGETHVFYHADDLYLNGYDDLLAKLSEMRQQENVKEEHFLEPLTDEQWKVMSEIGYPYAPGNAKEHEAAPVPDMIYWRLAAGMMTKDDVVRAFSTTGYTIGRDPERTNEILAELNIMYQKLDNDFKPLTADDKQEHVNDEFLNYVVYGERRYPIYQNMENRLNTFMKNSGVDIPLSHILYGENTKVNRWSDLHQIASRTVESILRESGQGDEKLLNSTTTDYVSDKAKTLALDIVRSIRVDEVNYEARRKEALKAIGYPYLKHTTNADGSFNIPTVDESLYWEYAAGVISLKDAAREFNRSGWTNFVDEKYTKAKFAQLNEQFGKLDADLKPLLAQQKELGEAKAKLFATILEAQKDLGDEISIAPTEITENGSKNVISEILPDFESPFEDQNIIGGVSHLKDEDCVHNLALCLENVNDAEALGKAVHEAHVKHLEQGAKQTIHDRIVTPSARSFTPNQVDALNRYQQIATPETPAREVFARLLHEVSQEPDVAQKSEKWIIDTAKELDEVAKGNTREDNQQLKR